MDISFQQFYIASKQAKKNGHEVPPVVYWNLRFITQGCKISRRRKTGFSYCDPNCYTPGGQAFIIQLDTDLKLTSRPCQIYFRRKYDCRLWSHYHVHSYILCNRAMGNLIPCPSLLSYGNKDKKSPKYNLAKENYWRLVWDGQMGESNTRKYNTFVGTSAIVFLYCNFKVL